MILKILKKKRSYNFILLLLLICLMILFSFLRIESYQVLEEGNQMPLYVSFLQYVGSDNLINCIFPAVFILLISLLLLRLNTTFPLIQEKTFLVPVIFVMIFGGFVFLQTMNPVYFGLLFLLFSLNRLFYACTKESGGLSFVFDAGFYIGVGSLFYFPLIFYFFIVWVGLFKIHGQLHGRYFILSVLGTLFPWLLTFSYYFFTDTQHLLNNIIYKNLYSLVNYNLPKINYCIYIGFIVLLTIISGFFLLSHVNNQKVVTRKYYGILFWILIVSIIIFIFVPSVSYEILMIIAVPLSFMITDFMVYIKKEFIGDIILLVFFCLIVWLQITA